MRTNESVRVGRQRIIAILAACSLLSSTSTVSAQWRHAHGDADNSGFARVDTSPAVTPQVSRDVGPIAPGANPVIGPDGTVYIGNLRGELRAFRAEGAEYWTRQLNPEHGFISAAPVVGADGSVYVVSTFRHEDSGLYDSFLHKFTPGGGWIFHAPFPKSDLYPYTDGGATNAPPNIWQWNGVEAIVIPAVYGAAGRKSLNVIAFSTSGAILGNHRVKTEVYEITTNIDWLGFAPYCIALSWWNAGVVCGFAFWLMSDGVSFTSPGEILPLMGAGFPLPSVAIVPGPQGWAPLVMVTDGKHDKVVLGFGPQTGFWRVNGSTNIRRTFTTSPVVQADGSTVVGTADGFLTFTGPDFIERSSTRSGLGILTATPTRLHDGSLVVVSREGLVTRFPASGARWQNAIGGDSIASAAASCTHVFVATTSGLFTFNARNMQQVASKNLLGGGSAPGGLSAPVIGPAGHVYTIASDTLFVFPAPRTGGVKIKTACDQLLPAP